MEKLTKLKLVTFSLFLLVPLLHGLLTNHDSETERKPYIVYMGDAPENQLEAIDRHHNMLVEVLGGEETARKCRIYSYGKSFDAFAAHLTPTEAKQIQDYERVVSVFPSTRRRVHTTRSWNFLGMPITVRRHPHVESDIIVGMIDTGIFIDSPSFNDKGFGPPPSKWKGSCQTGANFTGCNNKVIGARAYYLDPRDPPNPDVSPADDEGHGTHTSSTVAGIQVPGVSLYGLGEGIARGGVPWARIAMYKVCWVGGCGDMNLMAAFDDAIHDGVDLISLSIGGPSSSFFEDVVAIGSFHAMKKGILTVCSAGNDGPTLGSVENVAPWIFTVGATWMDRQFTTLVQMGNGMKFVGSSINTFTPEKRMYPLTSGSNAVNSSWDGNDEIFTPSSCEPTTLDRNKIKGKIVLCMNGYTVDQTIKELGGVGVIQSPNPDIGFTYDLPFVNISPEDAEKIGLYINSTKNPHGVIYKSRQIKARAPLVASFSSRGPNTLTYNILKPDIVAPGVDIIAAYSELISITGEAYDNRLTPYNFMSGTSMACPHVSGVSAFVKSFHPDWSPAAIKSALMTTTTEMAVTNEEDMAELSYGTGQVDPLKALHPGLIYDISNRDYIRFLCTEHYSGSLLRIVSNEEIDCSSLSFFGGADHLNYPSMYFNVSDPDAVISTYFHRVVTNVGIKNSIYKATVKAPKDLKVTIIPDTLEFNELFEKKSFQVHIKGAPLKNTKLLSASLEWSDSVHRVKSPIVISQAVPEPAVFL